ncbi:MAG TPA: class I SAM-dependent methyltransferase [Miltoncostaeaceae bacterium]|jgi:SAM-dependent methyltransferase|nr:class I SAM-dependent methyltransferase [Miltoncostaeaceae bacterium]
MPRLYADLADWYHLVTPPREYAEEADHVVRLLAAGGAAQPATMLELGCGGGNLASHLTVPELVLTDVSQDMLQVSRRINPGREHLRGDMRTLRLDRRFDAVLVHDAIDYMLTEEDLAAALRTVAAHLAGDGAAVLLPDATTESFAPGSSHGGDDGDDGRAVRYLEWVREPAPGATTYAMDFVFLLREPGGATRVVHDPHVCGVFPQATWDRLIAAAGLARADVAGVADPWPGEHVPMVVRPA